MKKLMYVSFVFAAIFMFTVPAFAAAQSKAPAQYDLLDLDGAPAAASTAPDSSAPVVDAPVDESTYHEETPAPVVDVPVDESTYREEPSTPYEPPVRLPGRGEIDDILAYWEEHGYPADVSYAFEGGGEVMEDGTVYAWWEIGLVDADEARQQEILEMVAPTCLVEFQTCLFTHAQKQTAYDTIAELAKTDENILEVIFIRNGDNVWVSVPEERTKEYAEYLIRDLGLGAVVSVTDQHSIASFENGLDIGIPTPGGVPGTPGVGIDRTTPQDTITGGLVPDTPAVSNTSPVFWVCLALAVTAACALTVLALRRRFAPAAVTENGAIRAASAPLTRHETEALVRQSRETPPDALRQELLRRVEEEH